jgi:hypothetical protein
MAVRPWSLAKPPRLARAEDERPATNADLQVLDERIRDIRAVIVGDARCSAFHFFHQPVEIIVRIGDADHADGGAVPQTAGIQFGDGDVETRTQPILQAAYDLPPILERLRRFDVEFEGEKSNQMVVSRWPNRTGHGS